MNHWCKFIHAIEGRMVIGNKTSNQIGNRGNLIFAQVVIYKSMILHISKLQMLLSNSISSF